MKATWLVALALVGGTAAGESVEDELAVVKKAVAAKPVAAKSAAPAAPQAAAAAPAVAEAPAGARLEEPPGPRAVPRPGKEPQWLRVRVSEKGGKKRVSVNLPLALVRVMGDDWPIDLDCGREGKSRPKVTLGEVLRALDSGQDLVQVDEEDATVRVWVE
jgi:hypothetical protein